MGVIAECLLDGCLKESVNIVSLIGDTRDVRIIEENRKA